MIITIRPIKQKGGVMLQGTYFDKETSHEVYLIENGTKVVTSLSERDKLFSIFYQSGTPKKITLSEDKKSYADAVIKFYRNHPHVQTEGYNNPNLITPLFALEIKDEKIKFQYQDLMGRIAVANKVMSLPTEDKADLAFALGGDAQEMDDAELVLYLIGQSLNGLATGSVAKVFQISKLQKVESQARIYANKAVRYGVIEKTDGAYQVAHRVAGSTIEEVANFLIVNSEIFDGYVKRQVDKLESERRVGIKATIQPEDIPAEIRDEIPALAAKVQAKGNTKGVPVVKEKENTPLEG